MGLGRGIGRGIGRGMGVGSLKIQASLQLDRVSFLLLPLPVVSKSLRTVRCQSYAAGNSQLPDSFMNNCQVPPADRS